MFTEQSKCTLTAEEQEFLEKAHLDISEEEADDRASEDVSGEDDNSGFSAGQYDLVLDWCDPAKAVYTVGQAVNFYRAPNLGGAAGVAALQISWKPGRITNRLPPELSNGFELYAVKGEDETDDGVYPTKQLKLRTEMTTVVSAREAPTSAVEDEGSVPWFERAVPRRWMNAPTPAAMPTQHLPYQKQV